MTVKVRSVSGDKSVNDSSPENSSPPTISLSDKIIALWLINKDTAQSVAPATGWTLLDELSNGTTDTRFQLYSKTAVQDDVDNQGTTDFYVYSGLIGTHDILYGVLSLYDDGAETVEYKASTLSSTVETDDDTTTDAASQIITTDGSLVVCYWVNIDGTGTPGKIRNSNSFAPTGGANTTKQSESGNWTQTSMSGAAIVCYTTEMDIADSPTGAMTLTHQDLDNLADGQHSVSMVFHAPAGGASITDVNLTGIGRGILSGVGRGVG